MLITDFPDEEMQNDLASLYYDHPHLRDTIYQLLPSKDEEWAKLYNKSMLVKAAFEIKDRLETTNQLKAECWNCDLRNNRNGTISYYWALQPSNKCIAGFDTETLQRYNIAGQYNEEDWQRQDQQRWTSIRDINLGAARLRDYPTSDESDSTQSISWPSRRRLNFD